MEELIGIRSNIYFTQVKDEKKRKKFVKHHELVIITTAVDYVADAEAKDGIKRVDKLNHHRIKIADSMIPNLLIALHELSKADPLDAK